MTQLETRRRRRRITLAAVAGVVVVAVVGGTAFAVLGSRGGSTTAIGLTSEVVDEPAANLTVTAPPSTYQITYRIDTYTDETPTTTTESITIRRPFDGFVSSKTGAPPGTDEQWHAVSNLGSYSDTTAATADATSTTVAGTDGSTTQVQKALPQTALGDFRLDATIGDLVAGGLFQPKEVRRVQGRECQVYRTGQPLESFGVAAATDTDYTDACIDSAGLMLEEVSVRSGALAQRLIATTVDDQPAITDATFAIAGDPVAVADGGTELTAVDAAAAPVPGYWLLDTPPEGYQLQGRYVLRHQANAPSATETTTTTAAGQPPVVVDSYVDVYVAGSNTIVIVQGPTTGEPDSQTTDGVSGELGTLGSTTAKAGLTGSTLVAHPANPASWYVHVSGTVPVATLQQVATALHA